MKPTKFTAGDEVIYKGSKWVVMDQVSGLVWISRYGESKQVRAGDLTADDND